MIRQFDVVANPIPAASRDKPYLLCVQHNNLNHLAFRVVASLATDAIVREASRLYPRFRIQDRTVFFIPHDVATRPVRQLGTAIANLETERDAIIAALDLVFTGV